MSEQNEHVLKIMELIKGEADTKYLNISIWKTPNI